MVKIFSIFLKNIQTIFNSKVSSLILILGPIFLILIVGSFLQDASLKNINLGVFSQVEDNFTKSFVEKLKEKSFNVYIDSSLEDCRNKVINSLTHGCVEVKKAEVVFPNNVEQSVYYNIKLNVDFSKQRIVWGIIGSVRNIIDEENKVIRVYAINQLNENLDSIKKDVEDREKALANTIYTAEKLSFELEMFENDLSALKEETGGANEEIENIRREVKKTRESVQSFRVFLGVNTLNDPYFFNLDQNINAIGNSLNNTKLSLDRIEKTINSLDVKNTQNNHEKIKKDLINSREHLGKLKQELGNIRNIDVERALDPLLLSYTSASNKEETESIKQELTFLDYLFPSFVMFFLLLVSIVFAATLSIKERESGAYIRNITSKTSGFTFVFSGFFTSFVVVFVQTVLLLSIAYFFLNLNLIENIFPILFLIIISITVFVIIGLLLGYLFHSQESAIVASISVALLFIIFSPLVSPVETLPKTIAKIIDLSPLVLLETKLRQVLIFNIPLNFSVVGMLSLVSFLVVSAGLLTIFYRISKRKEI